MTVQTEILREDYIGNGATAEYEFRWQIDAASDIRVIERDTEGVETVLVLDDDYTVNGVGNSTGSITLSANLQAGHALAILPNFSLTQPRDFRNQGEFFAETHEDAFDRAARIAQQQQEQIDRSMKLPETLAASGFNPTLPASVADRASAVIMTNAAGNGFAVGPTADQIASAQSYAQAAEAAKDAAEFALDQFDDRWLGAKATDPTVDNDGNPLEEGAQYFNTTIKRVKYYTGTAWVISYADAVDVDFTPSGTGAVTRTAQDKLRETVSVKDFGAVGDGVTDDTTAIERAIAGAGIGATILFPAGMNCLVSSELDMAVAGQRFVGYGAKITKSGSFDGNGILRADAANLTIEGLEIDGADKADDGIITYETADGLTVKNCTIHDCAYGISANNISDLLLEGNSIYAVARYGIRAHNILANRALSNIRIVNNHIDQSDQEASTSLNPCLLVRGDATYPTTGVLVSGNQMIQVEDPTNSAALGCEMRYVDGGVFSGNYAKDGAMLVSVALSSNVTVDGNVCDGATFYGIEVAGLSPTGCENVVVSNNTIHGRGRLNYGVGLQGTAASKGATVSGNTIQGTTLYGVFSNEQWSDLAINGNRIDITSAAANQYGIYLDGSATPIDHVSISGNTLNGNGVGEKAIYLRDVRYATVSGNALPGWTENGVYIRSDLATCDEISIVGNSINGLSSSAIGKLGTLGSRVMTAFNPPYRRGGTTAVNDVNLESDVIEAWGTGAPEGVVTAGVGSIYHNTAGAFGTTVFHKMSGTGNTGWVPVGLLVQTASAIADISSSVNTANKHAGRLCWDATNHRMMVAAGSAAADAWWVADGSASVTPA